MATEKIYKVDKKEAIKLYIYILIFGKKHELDLNPQPIEWQPTALTNTPLNTLDMVITN
jgi:hypothetical protein